MSAVDWSAYRKCPICHAPIGEPCTRLTGKVVDGTLGAYVEVEAGAPHKLRQPRAGR